MAIYHLESKVITRSVGRSAVAAAAYMSCSAICNEYDGIKHDYTRKGGLVWQAVFLPENAPAEWKDRSVLWNAVEESEKTKNSRLAREFVVALPVEVSKKEWIQILTEFIQKNFVSDGMCADVGIHDTGNGNPHAHIMLTVRPLDEKGQWQYKTKIEYLCKKDGEERGFTADEFKKAKGEGWEKQYQYKVDGKKVYMTPTEGESHAYERASKAPKATRFGRQNPITERWNSEESLISWRAQWADVVNKNLALRGIDERIDHRSFAERGMDEIPTIHEGVKARAMEAAGIVSDRCELNRQIKENNALIRRLKEELQKLMQAVKQTVPALAELLESLRASLLILRYKIINTVSRRRKVDATIEKWKEDLKNYKVLVEQIQDKKTERKKLSEEISATSVLKFGRKKELSAQLAKNTEDLQELLSEKSMRLEAMHCPKDKPMAAMNKNIAELEDTRTYLNQREKQFSSAFDDAMRQYVEAEKQSVDVDPNALQMERKAIRKQKEDEVRSQLKDGEEHFSFNAWFKSQDFVDKEIEKNSVLKEVPDHNRYLHHGRAELDVEK